MIQQAFKAVKGGVTQGVSTIEADDDAAKVVAPLLDLEEHLLGDPGGVGGLRGRQGPLGSGLALEGLQRYLGLTGVLSASRGVRPPNLSHAFFPLHPPCERRDLSHVACIFFPAP